MSAYRERAEHHCTFEPASVLGGFGARWHGVPLYACSSCGASRPLTWREKASGCVTATCVALAEFVADAFLGVRS